MKAPLPVFSSSVFSSPAAGVWFPSVAAFAVLLAARPVAGQASIDYADGSSAGTLFSAGTGYTLNSLGGGQATDSNSFSR